VERNHQPLKLIRAPRRPLRLGMYPFARYIRLKTAMRPALRGIERHCRLSDGIFASKSLFIVMLV
jgi:hypothetical protein